MFGKANVVGWVLGGVGKEDEEQELCQVPCLVLMLCKAERDTTCILSQRIKKGFNPGLQLSTTTYLLNNALDLAISVEWQSPLCSLYLDPKH